VGLSSSIRFRLFFVQVYKRRMLFLIRVGLKRRRQRPLPQMIHGATDIDDSRCKLQAIAIVDIHVIQLDDD
jgi:hypothetical protein